MLPKWTWVVLNVFIFVGASLDDDTAKAFVELTELDYEDTCYEVANAEWSFIGSPSNRTTLSIWEEKQIEYAYFKQNQTEEIRNISRSVINNPSLRYKYDVIVKPGDALLDIADWEEAVRFIGTSESLQASTGYAKKTEKYVREGVEQVLLRGGTAKEKRVAWTTWHKTLEPLVGNFSYNLQLLRVAADKNGVQDIEKYWEMLSDYAHGYAHIKEQWSRIVDLHKKIVKFAKTHFSQKYGVNVTEGIPAYLLGSLKSDDWSTITIDMAPYTEFTHNIKRNLWKEKLIGIFLYKSASHLSSEILNQVPQADFWDKSEFNQQCPSKLINFCRDGIVRISTCFEPTITNYLAAHKNIAKVSYHQMSAETMPILNIANRYSGLEEGIAELFGILSASPAWLNRLHLMPNSSNNEERQIVSLMITALDVLPRLAYYLSVDLWRINAIESNITDPTELTKSWWHYRSQYEGITFDSPNVPSFLNDDYILRNKPYLSKFVGILLGFQLYEYIMESTEIRYEYIYEKGINSILIKMLREGAADEWMNVLNKYLEIDSISESALLSFLTPLEDFVEEMEEDFEYVPKSSAESELDEVKKAIVREMNAPSTTPTTTTTTKKTLNDLKILIKNKVENVPNGVSDDTKSAKNKLPINVQADKPRDDNDAKLKDADPNDKSMFEIEGEEVNEPKTNTSKAVWAVAAVLVATVTICVIAIFGRQRCRKTPKNRRYV